MIRIYPKDYTKKEKVVLNDLLNEMNIMFTAIYCKQYDDPDFDCSTCDVRHICYDIEKIINFSEELNENHV